MTSRLVSRLSTLEAARTIFFIVVGLAIKQSLGLFAHTWPSKDFPGAPDWSFWTRTTIAAGYLFTVIRFSHGVSLLYGHEKQRIETSNLPSASKISELSLFLVLLAIPLFLMADNITETNSYIVCTAFMLAIDFMYVLRSGVVRHPLKRIFKILRETEPGYAAHAAFWWMTTDVVLCLICGLFFVRSGIGSALASKPPAREILFAGVLILAAVADYLLSWDFYFGGRKDHREQKFVFIISPLRNPEPSLYKENINRAQLYCLNLMNWRSRFGKQITPLASHAFFPYFLNDGLREDTALGVECALAYLSACDAVYVYVPVRDRWLKAFLKKDGVKPWVEMLGLSKSFNEGRLNGLIETLEKENLTPGMRYTLDAARTNGIEIKYLKEICDLPSPQQWFRPNWVSITYERAPPERKPSESYFKGAAQRKKVYVCTRFRGKGFDDMTWAEQIEQMQANSKLALWHCHELVRDPNEAVAPFAPQAFYPYFWKFTDDNGVDRGRFKAWFDRSIEILKVCDAVYIYTPQGFPPTEADCSSGVLRVHETARKLGLEIQYRKELTLPEEPKTAKQELDAANKTVEQVMSEVTSTGTKWEVLTKEAQAAAASAMLNLEKLKARLELVSSEAEAKRSLLEKRTWDPAVPRFD